MPPRRPVGRRPRSPSGRKACDFRPGRSPISERSKARRRSDGPYVREAVLRATRLSDGPATTPARRGKGYLVGACAAKAMGRSTRISCAASTTSARVLSVEKAIPRKVSIGQ